MATATKSGIAELTPRVIALGIFLAVVMGAANVYLGLKAGMTVSASIPASVIAMLLLRKVMRGGTVLEANQVQTAASAGESLAAGIIFTMPALLLIGAWQDFDFVITTLIAFTGGLLGILFMIPMRKVFVVREVPELTYPEGVACAAVLKAGDEEDSGGAAASIIFGALVGAVVKVLISFVGVIHNALAGAWVASNRIIFVGGDISPALIAVGYIVRLNVAILIFIGGAMAWLIGIPLLGGAADFGSPMDGAFALWSGKIRYVGVGAMVVGGIAAIIKVRGGLVAAVQEIRKKAGGANDDGDDGDINSKAILGWGLLATVLVGGIYYYLTKNIAITLVTTVIMIVMSLFFTAVASYIVGLVGNSNSPVSGMTITAVLFTGALLFVFGFSGTEGMVATLGVAAIVCCAACTSGDVCNDLKTGQIVGASPRKQQIMQILGVAVASLVMAPVMQLLHTQTPGGIGGKELSAPQAGLFASLADGFFGEGQLPWNLVAIGAVIGVAMVAFDFFLEKKGSNFRAHVMPIAVGMYLPFELAPPILAGGLIAHFLAKGSEGEEAEKKLRRGILFSSGTIAGEALMGVGLAILAAAGIQRLDLGLDSGLVNLLTAIVVAAVLAIFWIQSKPRTSTT